MLDLEIKIIHELRVRILKHEDLLIASARVCAELDWYGRPNPLRCADSIDG